MAAVGNIRVPFDASEVNEEWFKEVFSSVVQASDITVKGVKQDGLHENGLLSCIFHATISYKDVTGGEKETKVFVKIMPPDDLHRFIINNSFMDITEIESYRVLFHDINEFERNQYPSLETPLNSFLPTYFAGDAVREKDKRAYYLMLEDLSPEFGMENYDKGLSLEQLLKSMEGLAYFHAICYCYGKTKKINFGSKYQFLSTFFSNFDHDQELKDFMKYNMDMVVEDLKKEKRDDLLPHVMAVKENIGLTYKNLIKQEGNESFLIHGDIWANNVMFNQKYHPKIVDWQFTATGSIFLDIGTLGYLSCDPVTTEANLATIKSAYYNVFKRVCDDLKVPVPWESSEFDALAEEHGLFLAFLWCSTSYELVLKYPQLMKRAHWCLEQSIRRNPHFFK